MKETKTLNVIMTCQAVYYSTIEVPSDLSLEEAKEYAEKHADNIPITFLSRVPDSDELLLDSCSF